MAARHRGRTTPFAQALITLIGLALLCLMLLGRRQEAEAGDGTAADSPSGTAGGSFAASGAGVATPAVTDDLRGRPDAALQAAAEARIADAFALASKLSSGKAHAGNCTVTMCVRARGSLRELVSIGAGRALRPASNMKLATTAAALALLGPGWSFSTDFEGSGPLEGGRPRGDLVVRAGGDPLWAPAGDGRAEPRLEALARELHLAGLRVVEGDLVLDPRSFAPPAPGPGWPPASQHWDDYCALAAAFTVNGGVLTATVTPGAPGAAARVEVHPSPTGIPPRHDVRTEKGGPLDVRVGATTAAVTVRGRVPADLGTWTTSFAHPDPVLLFESVLVDALEGAGIELRGGVRVQRDAPGGLLLATLRSPLLDVLGPINTESVNPVADQLFLATGLAVAGEATRAGGRAATAEALRRLGVGSEGLVQVDGSGLSRDNRLSARQLVALQQAVLGLDAATVEAWLDSLAVGGSTGTLEKRMLDPALLGRVRGKTGWIAGTSALAGVVTTPAGREYVFSILVDYPQEVGGLNRDCWKPMQDDLLALLVEAAP